jgi:hypothetical protein
MPTAIGISLPLKTHFLPSTSLANLISSFRYEGAFEKNERHGQGIETFPNGSRYFSPFKDSILSINLSYAFNIYSYTHSKVTRELSKMANLSDAFNIYSYMHSKVTRKTFENGEWHGQGIFKLACSREIT